MSQSYPSQYIDDDFLDVWQDNGVCPMDFDDYASPGIFFPARSSQQILAGAHSDVDIDAHKADAVIKHEDNFDLDLSLDWMPDTSSHQFSNNQFPNHANFPSRTTDQLLPFNIQYSNTANDSEQYLHQDCPLSAYPPLDLDETASSLPYGHQVTQQSKQALPLTAQNLHNDDFGFPPNVSFPSFHNRYENSGGSKRTSHFSLDNRKVSLNRTAKQRGDPSCDPSLCYSANPGTPAPWGSMTWNGQHLFSYTSKGQWLRDRCFDKQQFREYADNCGKETVFWVQQAPTQCNHRLDPEDRICRWANCPVSNRTITAGWLRVAFDEFPHLTSNGARDPLKCAGSVHLWCFEQIFDPAEFHLSGRLRAEDRQFPFEDKSVVTLEKLTDAGIIREAYQPWFAQRMQRFNLHNRIQLPREYRETLSYRLNKYHLDNQTAARQKARSKRNNSKSEDERRTIDVHLGNLKMFVEITNKARRSKKSRKLRIMKAGYIEMDSSVASSTCSLEAGLFGGRQSDLAQLISGSAQNRDLNTSHTAPTLNLNMSSRLPNYFDPLNPAQNMMRPSNEPSLTTTTVPPNKLNMSASSFNYCQRAPGAKFNMGTRAQARRSLRPLITQPQQQHAFPTMIVPLKVEEQRQLEAQRNNLNSQFETQGDALIKDDPDEADVFAQPPEDSLGLFAGSSGGTSFFDSHRRDSTGQEDMDIGHLLDPRLFRKELENDRHREGVASEVNTTVFTAHRRTDPIGCQPLGLVDRTVSPQDTAASESWDSLGKVTDSMVFGGFSGADSSPLFDGFSATNGVGGESSRNC
ncbi:hypothetical protein TARUN_3085 [Trichoderma arundinaceum]|uniref:Uncharacterized protein n=1 Tax=Trichoderma arundinaceum TaxID=490622 RepID=A0A395NST3_TRIAR|nr:hypothetical protein TARUN_3085 [Trichoderma arundinaceum]